MVSDDVYENLGKLSKSIYKHVKPRKKEIQKKLTPYSATPEGYKKRETYPRNWSLYGKALSQEKLMFLRILKDTVDYMMIEYKYAGNGRPPVFYGDIIKALCIKAYHQYSGCRAQSELKIARAMGIIDEIYGTSTLLKYMQDEKIIRLLHKLYKIIAEPIAPIEVYFAADATGLSHKFGNMKWSKLRHTKEELKKRREYSKLHIISGCKTNVIASAKITKGNKHESPFFKPLLDDTAKIFDVKEVMADAGYLSKKNVEAVTNVGAVPYIMAKKDTHVPMRGTVSAWGGMLRMWKKHQMFFAQHYHKRSNVESTFSALKRKYGDFCRCKKESSQECEILAKIVCFNSAVLAEALLSYDLECKFIGS